MDKEQLIAENERLKLENEAEAGNSQASRSEAVHSGFDGQHVYETEGSAQRVENPQRSTNRISLVIMSTGKRRETTMNETLPPKTCTIDRLVTKEAEVGKVLAGQKQRADATDVMQTSVKRWIFRAMLLLLRKSTSKR